jgi:hypothetical protein
MSPVTAIYVVAEASEVHSTPTIGAAKAVSFQLVRASWKLTCSAAFPQMAGSLLPAILVQLPPEPAFACGEHKFWGQWSAVELGFERVHYITGGIGVI